MKEKRNSMYIIKEKYYVTNFLLILNFLIPLYLKSKPRIKELQMS